MALGQKYSFTYNNGQSSVFFWAKNDAEAISRIKQHKFPMSQNPSLTNHTTRKEVKLDIAHED
tara:strand:+ start:12 stop:200 length:189 start_codon:yes stop_codon:yes gene_type:complete